jgi:hypothetical protein
MKNAGYLFLIVLLIGSFNIQINAAGPSGPAANKSEQEGGVSGIVFFNTQKLDELKRFYIDKVGCRMWMDQGDCVILRFGNMLTGFCKREKADLQGLITFFYDSREGVDRAYAQFKDIADAAPRDNPKYPIYHFFAKDPEGRGIEFQYFTNKIDWDFEAMNR